MSTNIIPDYLINVPNIEHCSVRVIGDPAIFYIITADEGWYIHRDAGFETSENVWKTTTTLRADENPEILIIVPEAELPEDAEILGDVPTDTETM